VLGISAAPAGYLLQRRQGRACAVWWWLAVAQGWWMLPVALMRCVGCWKRVVAV
jgi:hypothetical protein